MPLVAPTGATDVFELAHVPPVVALVSVEVLPSQTVIVPAMGVSELTVMVKVEMQPTGVV